MNRPQLIVITPVRNEAWVLDAFLTHTSSWADVIIIADQRSTDGSREIIKHYQESVSGCKVIMVDNSSEEMNQAYARQLLFKEVDKIDGDKIVFALDADEFLTQGFANTPSWEKILNSPTNSIFSFKWINLLGDFKHILPQGNGYMEWVCHFDPSMKIADEYSKCENRAVHEMRIPCLSPDRSSYIHIDDIQFIHLARLNSIRTLHKEDFYQVSSIAKLPKNLSGVSLYRAYHNQYRTILLENELMLLDKTETIDVKSKVHSHDPGQYYIDETLAIIRRMGRELFFKIDIWERPYMLQSDIDCNIPFRYKLFHKYLRKTNNIKNQFAIRVLDKLLKYLV